MEKNTISQVSDAAVQMLSYLHHAAAEQNDKMGLIKDRERFPDLAASREEKEQACGRLTGTICVLAWVYTAAPYSFTRGRGGRELFGHFCRKQ